MTISLSEARARVATADIYKELRSSDREGYLDLPAGAIVVKYRIVSDSNLNAEIHRDMADAAAQMTTANLREGETIDEMADRFAEELSNRQAQRLVDRVVEWDLAENPGEPPIPLEVDAVRMAVPREVVNDVLAGILVHRSPPKNARKR